MECFSHLLGTYWGTSIQVGTSLREEYALCVYAGESPEPEFCSVLNYNIDSQTALYDSGMHHRIYITDGERIAHAWGDNTPDEPLVSYQFEDWITDRVADIIRILTRKELASCMQQLEYKTPTSTEEWNLLRERLLLVQERLCIRSSWPKQSTKDIISGISGDYERQTWEITFGLARCARGIGSEDREREMIDRFKNGFVESGVSGCAIVNPVFQKLCEPFFETYEDFWCTSMKEPMIKLAKYKRCKPDYAESSKLSLSKWLIQLENRNALQDWLNIIYKYERDELMYIYHAAHLAHSSLADMALPLLSTYVDMKGEIEDVKTLRAIISKQINTSE